jgi:uncharacterized protein YdhG (YjbR/CyaY superfamily)
MTVDEYLDAAPEPHASTLRQIRATLRELLPDATETISYGMPAFKERGKAIAGYAHFKNHCSYFPHSGAVLPVIAEELEGYDWSKGTLRFATDQPLPSDLIRRLVAVRRDQLDIS